MKAEAIENKPETRPAIQYKPALIPQKRWLITLSFIFGAWVIFLLVLYFKTTFPLRH